MVDESLHAALLVLENTGAGATFDELCHRLGGHLHKDTAWRQPAYCHAGPQAREA